MILRQEWPKAARHKLPPRHEEHPQIGRLTAVLTRLLPAAKARPHPQVDLRGRSVRVRTLAGKGRPNPKRHGQCSKSGSGQSSHSLSDAIVGWPQRRARLGASRTAAPAILHARARPSQVARPASSTNACLWARVGRRAIAPRRRRRGRATRGVSGGLVSKGTWLLAATTLLTYEDITHRAARSPFSKSEALGV